MQFIKRYSVFLFYCISLFSDFQMQHSLFFVVEPVNQLGQILGPAPVFQATKTNCSPCVNATYSIATNGINKKMSAFLDADMPAGTSLTVNLAPPQNARSMGAQMLSITPVDLVIEISQIAESELALEYQFKVDLKAGVTSGITRVVFYTLTDG